MALRKVKPMLITVAVSLVAVFSAAPAQACTIELEFETGTDLYRISPLVDDGLSNATRVNCTLGELVYNMNQTGWDAAIDDQGQPLILRDIRGINWRGMTFLVFVNEHGMVGMRFGPPEQRFLDSSNRVSVFPMEDYDGTFVQARRVSNLNTKPDGSIWVEVETGNSEYCSITSNPSGQFDFTTTVCEDYS